MSKDKQPPPTAALNVRGLPRKLRDAFRGWCCERGYTVQEAIEMLLRRTIRENQPLHGDGLPEA